MAHEQKKQSTGSWKAKRDSHQKADRQKAVTTKKKEKPGWVDKSGKRR